MRFAHLAPAIGAIDFCYRDAKTSSFVGPVLGGGGATDAGPSASDAGEDADAAGEDAGVADAAPVIDDGGAPSIAFRGVSTYQTLEAAGPLTIGIVAGGASSCAERILEQDVTLDTGKLSTVVLLGTPGADGGDALAIVAFTDDRETIADKARVRVVNAAAGAEAIAARALGAQEVVLADEVLPRHAATASVATSVDALGYATVSPVPPPAAIALGPAKDAGGPTWQSGTTDLGIVGGSLHTAFVLAGSPYAVLWCTDTSTSGARTTCALVK
jgi:hypothetical protein